MEVGNQSARTPAALRAASRVAPGTSGRGVPEGPSNPDSSSVRAEISGLDLICLLPPGFGLPPTTTDLYGVEKCKVLFLPYSIGADSNSRHVPRGRTPRWHCHVAAKRAQCTQSAHPETIAIG